MTPQSSIAHYRIVSKLGEGGMGAVYRATDTKLNRDVAIKVLPDSFANDPDRLARFTREAQVLASLNHPNIAAIYGVEDRALVLELVEGATLAERIAQGPISTEEALPLIHQLIDALEYAHDKGIVHRDLKPANIKNTPEGRLKVLDFGLAKALASDTATPDPASSPTLTMRATLAGVIMGTAGYMSPEQARGHNTDRRADIWAFGVILYEMLGGRSLFEGPTVSDTLAAVLTRDPDLSFVPARFRRLLRLCLTRDPRQRLSHISAARILLDEPAPAPVPPPSPARRRAILPWIVAALSLGAAAVSLTRFQSAASLPVVRFQLPVLEKAVQPTFELSPDGRFVAVAAATDGPRHLAIRALDSTELRDVPGTEDARYPAWSPGSSSLVFFSQGKLKKIVATGGAAQPLCDAADGRGASWSFDGTIVFAPSDTGPLFRVPSSGGTPVAVTKTPSTGPRETDRYPSFLPNSDRFLFLHVTGKPENSGVYLGSLGGAPPIRILPDQTSAYYVPDASTGKGWIVFHRETSVMAQPLDAGNARVSGEAVQLATLVGGMANTNRWAFSASANGVLAFWQNAGGARQQLVWVDRNGGRLGDVINTSPVLDFEVSPDGKRLVVRVGGAHSDFWLQDLERSSRSRFTFNEHADGRAVWSPDGRTIAYTERPAATLSRIYRKPADSSAKEEILLESDHQLYVNDWSTDGRYLSYHVQSQDRQQDLLLLPTSSSSRGPIPYQNSPAGESRGAFSPDSHWMAYTSNESSEPRVYVQAIPPSGPKWQVSTAGGDRAAWRRDGRELYYIASDRKLMAVPVEAGPAGFHAGIPKPLFEVAGFSQYQPAPDGQRFLVQLPPEGEPSVPPLDMILNWPQVVHRP